MKGGICKGSNIGSLNIESNVTIVSVAAQQYVVDVSPQCVKEIVVLPSFLWKRFPCWVYVKALQTLWKKAAFVKLNTLLSPFSVGKDVAC